jgi:hypothetical protein
MKGGLGGGVKREHIHTSALATSSENSESIGSGLRCTTCISATKHHHGLRHYGVKLYGVRQCAFMEKAHCMCVCVCVLWRRAVWTLINVYVWYVI